MNIKKAITAVFEVLKAGHKSLASHFGKAAAHHTMKADVHKEHHATHGDMAACHKAAHAAHKAMHDAFKKADVSDGAPGSVPTGTIVDFHKAMMDHHKAMESHHAAKAAGHMKVHKGHMAMCTSCKGMADSQEETGKAAGEALDLAKADTSDPGLPDLQKALGDSPLAKLVDGLKQETQTLKTDLQKAQETITAQAADIKKIGDTIVPGGTAVEPKLPGDPALVLRGPKGEKISVLKGGAPQVTDGEPAMAGAGV